MAEKPAALYRRLYETLVAEAHATLHDQAHAEGVVQQAFVATFDRYASIPDPEADVRRRVSEAVRAAAPAVPGEESVPLGDLHPDYRGAVDAMYARRRTRAGITAGAAAAVVLLLLGFLLTRGGGGGDDASAADTGTETTATDTATTTGTTAVVATTPPPATTAATTAPPTTVGTYVVEAGDGWLAVAQKVGVPLDVLLEANGATIDTLLFVGQEIVVPAVTGPQYEVNDGDTWCTVSEKLGIPVEALLAANAATLETSLVPDTVIRLPDAETAATATGTVGC